MKICFRSTKPIAAICVIFLGCLTSCQDIRITGSERTSNKLNLFDRHGKPADTFEVKAGSVVKWQIKTGDVRSLGPISAKSSEEYDVFKREPHKKFLSRTWKGKIKPDASGKTEEYNLVWKDKDGTSHTYDPKIQVY